MQRRLAAILAADVAGYSRLMNIDEAGTLSTLQRCLSECLEPTIARHGGRVVKLIGDGLLAEFPSVVEAVSCAAGTQRDLATMNKSAPPERQMLFRIGVHLGDIIGEGEDIYGEGVNIAARLEGIAQPGGICISRQAYDQVQNKLPLRYQNLGARTLKNIPEKIEVFAVFEEGVAPHHQRQEIHYCRAADGVRLAYAISGEGPPLVKAANWLHHLEYDWESPIWHYFLTGLSAGRRLIRYDARGNGLSDWEVDQISLDAWVSDLETVVDAAGLDRFPIFAISQGCAVSIAFAARHPERVTKLIFLGGFARGANRRTPAEAAKRKAVTTLVALEWAANSPAIRQLFTSSLMPDATREQADSFNELQRRTTSADCAARYLVTTAEFDVTDLLGQIKAPTLVMHARNDAQVPIEAGKQMAAGIPGARFVTLQGNNHIPLEQDPATKRILEEIGLFLAE
jgi:class 3 adenylate cyclase/pimeloyl-ACP methyl ester carboxylesterase